MSDIIVVKQEAVLEHDGRTSLIVDVVLGGNAIHVHIPAAAIPNRMALYGLGTEAEAIEAILREHATRELHLPDHDHVDPKIARMGGLRQDVTIRQGSEADLPPVPPRPPTAKEKLLAAAEGANSMVQLRQAIIDFAKD